MFISLFGAPVEGAYPFATFSYWIINVTTSPGVSCEQMKMIIKVNYTNFEWLVCDVYDTGSEFLFD